MSGVTSEWLLLGGLGSLSFFVRGLTGAASAIVFNAGLLVAISLGSAIDLKEGQYWLALANALVSILMGAALLRTWRPERFIVLLTLSSVPINVLVSRALPNVDSVALELLLSAALVGSGIYLLMPGVPRTPTTEALTTVAIPVGIVAGVLDGLFGMGGAATILFLASAGGTPSVFRSRFAAVAIASSGARFLSLASADVYNLERLSLFAATLPFILAGLAAGFWAHRYLRPGPFRTLLALVVTAAGASSLAGVLQT